MACFSFNTVYASTQTSDSLCTVLFVAAVVLFMRAHLVAASAHVRACRRSGGRGDADPAESAVAADLAGGHRLGADAAAAAIGQLAVFAAAAFLVLAPWTIRNARLTGRFMPASAHGGIQLWYGSLQVGPFFTHWFDNPRDVFGEPVFPSARPDGRPLVASSLKPIGGNCAGVVPQTVGVTYWTDRDPTRVSLPLRPWQEGGVHFEIPPQPNDTAIYYYYDATWTSPSGPIAQQSPVAGPFDPNIFFVTSDDFGDQDRHDDFVDVFDVVRLARHEAWREAVAQPSTLDFDHDGSLTFHDLDIAIGILESDKNNPIAVAVSGNGASSDCRRDDGDARVSGWIDAQSCRVRFPAGCSISTPAVKSRGASCTPGARRGASVCRGTRCRDFDRFRRASILPAASTRSSTARSRSRRIATPGSRWTTSAARRSPTPLAMARRMVGIFVTVGSESRDAAHQFAGSRALYFAGAILSVTVFALFVSGLVVAAVRRGADIVPLAAAVLYVPVTISPFLTNARYSLSGQPFVFAFVAIAIVAAYDRLSNH